MATLYELLILDITADAVFQISDKDIYWQWLSSRCCNSNVLTVFSCSRSSFVKAQSFESKSPK